MTVETENFPSIVPGLAKLAGAEDTLEAKTPFTLVLDEVAIRVAYSWGTTPTVSLSAPYPSRSVASAATNLRDAPAALPATRPLEIILTRESDDERTSKAKGIAVEVQTGDADFDRDIYIHSFSEAHVIAKVLSPEVRRAVRMLFADGFSKIIIDDDDGNITTSRGNSTDAKASAADVAKAFATIASRAPVVEQVGSWQTIWLPPALVVSALICVPAAFYTAAAYVSAATVAVGALIGAPAGLAAGILVGRTQYGTTSNAHWRVRMIVASFIALGLMLGIAAAMFHTGASARAMAIYGAVLLAITSLISFLFWRSTRRS